MMSADDKPGDSLKNAGQGHDYNSVHVTTATPSEAPEIKPNPEVEPGTEEEVEEGASFIPHPREWAGKFGCLDFTLNPVVFFLSMIIIWGFIIWCLVDKDANTRIGEVQSSLVEHFSWLYIGSVVGFFIFMVFLLFHPTYSQIKLGKPDQPPKYSMSLVHLLSIFFFVSTHQSSTPHCT